MKAQPPSPYYDYTAIRDPRRFFGRVEEVRDLLDACDKKRNTSLVGVRHIGKTSLLNYITQPSTHQQWGYTLQRHIMVFIDLRHYLSKTRVDFFASVCTHIYEHGRQYLPTLQLVEREGEERFEQLVNDLDGAGFHCVLLLDAFDNVVNNPQFNWHFFSFLRALATRRRVTYIIASIKPLHELIINRPEIVTSPFFNIFRNLQLGPLTEDEALQLIQKPANEVAYPFTSEEVTWILQQAGHHPFFLQVVCDYLFTEKCRHDSVVDYPRVLEQIKDQLYPHFDQAWYELTENQQTELKTSLAQPLTRDGKWLEYRQSQLFCQRIREQFRVKKVEITTKDVKDALDHLSDSNYLQSCKLAQTNYVTGNGQQDSNVVRVITDLLRKAFEKMRVAGTRSDALPEWRLYNILYYHYFLRSPINNEQIAARLGIKSRRQFYREQDRAIQAITREVNILEESSYSSSSPSSSSSL